MRPLALLAAGVVVVGVDIRIGGFDALADVVGWVVCLVAVFSLRGASAWFQLAIIASAAGILLSLRGSIRSPAAGLLESLEILVQTALVFAVCSGIIERLRSAPGPDPAADSSVVTQANVLRWLDVALTVVSVGFVLAVAPSLGGLSPAGGMLGVVIAVLVAGLALIAWFLILLIGLRRHPSLQPSRTPA